LPSEQEKGKLAKETTFRLLLCNLQSLILKLLNILSKIFFMFERIHLQQVVKGTEELRKFIQVILGPRQVGKITELFG
jgi:predicted AAA+ superfamily ATPase